MSGAKVAGMRVSVGACVTTSMQGYADLGRPAQPTKHIAKGASEPRMLRPLLETFLKHHDGQLTCLHPDHRIALADLRLQVSPAFKAGQRACMAGSVMINQPPTCSGCP
jgi:hypothetical protein